MAETKSNSGLRPKKRRFCGNRYSSNSNVPSADYESASAKKIKLDCMAGPSDAGDCKHSFNGYRIFDIEMLFSTIESCLSCKGCGGPFKIEEDLQHGLSSRFCICCKDCGAKTSFRNSRMLGPRLNIPEINRRSIYAMRTLGLGLTNLKTFCGVMDLPPPVSEKTSRPILASIKNAVAITAEDSMKRAVLEEKSLTELESGICVSGDGTWKTRGHSSRIGVCSVIGAESGKVIDVEILSSACKACQSYKGVKEGTTYEEWWESHAPKCMRNHSGSAARMEVEGMCRIFGRSESNRGTRYLQYIGDGDTKTYPEIKKLKPYGNSIIEKIECINHVKKRMGARLRKIKLQQKGKKLSDGKTLNGKGRLTDKVINSFSSYYGNAIRKHKDSLLNMRKAIWAIYYHSRSTDNEPTHHFCPKGSSSYCKYQVAVANNLQHAFKHKNGVPPAVMDEIKSVFQDLSQPTLLKRCLQNRTQNANESLNSVIWKYCSKNSGSGRVVAEIATYEAVIAFNDGSQGRLRTMSALGLLLGRNAKHAAIQADKRRIMDAEKQTLASSKGARRVKRKLLSQKFKKHLKHEGVLYAAGEF